VFNPQPLKKRKKRSKPKATFKELDLQLQVNSLLYNMGLKYFRCPDLLYRLLGWDKRLKAYEKAQLASVFSGIPDNIVFVPLGNFCLCLNLELKSNVGKQSPRQRTYAKHLPVTVVRSLQEAHSAIKDLLGMVDHLNTLNKENE